MKVISLISEVWKDIPKFDGLYQASNLGNIRRIAPSNNGRKGGNILRPRIAKNGYVQVCLSHNGKNYWRYLHRVVCETFHGSGVPGMVVCHGDGIRTNNSADNLRWDTRANNEADRIKHGTSNRGSRHGMSKYTEDEIREAKLAIAAGMRNVTIANKFGIHPSVVGDIRTGKRWRHV